jgi:hypothetical protein
MAGQDLIIELQNAVTTTAKLYNTIGQVVYQKELEFVSGVAHLPLVEGCRGRTGVYILRLETAAGKSHIERILLN